MIRVNNLVVSLKDYHLSLMIRNLLGDSVFGVSTEGLPYQYDVKRGVLSTPNPSDKWMCDELVDVPSDPQIYVERKLVEAFDHHAFQSYHEKQQMLNLWKHTEPDKYARLTSVYLNEWRERQEISSNTPTLSSDQERVLNAMVMAKVQGSDMSQGLKAVNLDSEIIPKGSYLGGYYQLDTTVEVFLESLQTERVG